MVTVVIPTRDRLDLLERCVSTILRHTRYSPMELLVVDNESVEPGTLGYLSRFPGRVVRYDAPFNFSAINNLAAREARGELLAFLNNDIEVIDGGWLEEMVAQALRVGVGAVGARLLYPDRTLQHGGIVLGIGGVAGHAHKYLPAEAAGYFGRARLTQTMSAVTAACLVVRKAAFVKVGGFDEALPVAYNDVDFCLRVRAAGYRNVWAADATLIHHESKSRGREDSSEKRERFQRETETMLRRWGASLLEDPAYNPNLTLESENFAIAWPPRTRPPWTG